MIEYEITSSTPTEFTITAKTGNEGWKKAEDGKVVRPENNWQEIPLATVVVDEPGPLRIEPGMIKDMRPAFSPTFGLEYGAPPMSVVDPKV